MRSESARARWAFLLIISLGLFIVAADNSILYVALPTLRAELHTSHQQGLWIINAYPLVLAGLLLGTGTLGDKIGHRRMFEIGLTIFGIASAVAAFAPNVGVLIGARAFLGAGAAVLMPSRPSSNPASATPRLESGARSRQSAPPSGPSWAASS